MVFDESGKPFKSLPLHQRVLAICEKSLGPEHPYTSNALDNLAVTYSHLGKYADALPLQERALAIEEKVMGKDCPGTAIKLMNMAMTYYFMCNYAKSIPLLERALEIDEKALSPSSPELVTIRLRLARNLYLYGSDNIKAQRQVSNAYRTILNNKESALLLDEATRLSWQKKNLSYEMLDLLNPEQTTETILQTKGMVLDSLLKDQRALSILGKDSPKARELLSARLRIGNLAFSTKKEDQETVVMLKAQIDSIARFASLQKNDLVRSPDTAGKTSAVVASSLPEGGILVEFIQFIDPKIKDNGGRCYGVLILRKDGNSKFLRVENFGQINDSIRAFNEALARKDETQLRDNLKILSKMLWEPLAKNLPKNTKKLFIGGDGQLNFISFATLLDENEDFLAQHYDIAYVGSGRDLTHISRPINSKTIALFADPVFDRQATSISTNGLTLRSAEVDALGKIKLLPLPGTRKEEAAVEETAKTAGWFPETYLGTSASKSAILNVNRPGILHLATHGFYLNSLSPQDADGDRGMQVMEAPGVGRKQAAPQLKIDPMNASGIALTGAQFTLRAWSEGKVPSPMEDGILTAEEVGALNLDGTWLVTLSACETGVGDARSGEGVFGLRRAFMIAGAQNLLMTLWPVSDEVTPKIMADFYKEALATHDAAGSLAKVQSDWLVKLRKEKGLLAAVRDAGPFAMVVMANPNAKPLPPESTSKAVAKQQAPLASVPDASNATGSPPSSESPASSASAKIPEFNDALAKADAGDAYAQAVVSIYYGLGYKTEKDLSKSAEYASKSAEQHHPLGHYQLGVLTAGGEGVEKDLEKGKSLKVESIEGLNTMSDDPYALAALGAMALRGEGVAKDMKKAAKLYRQSADLGYAPAQVLYAMMLTKGVGVASSPDAARKYTRMAEEQNYHP
jgi:CHAT domain-containing protein